MPSSQQPRSPVSYLSPVFILFNLFNLNLTNKFPWEWDVAKNVIWDNSVGSWQKFSHISTKWRDFNLSFCSQRFVHKLHLETPWNLHFILKYSVSGYVRDMNRPVLHLHHLSYTSGRYPVAFQCKCNHIKCFSRAFLEGKDKWVQQNLLLIKEYLVLSHVATKKTQTEAKVLVRLPSIHEVKQQSLQVFSCVLKARFHCASICNCLHVVLPGQHVFTSTNTNRAHISPDHTLSN